MADCKSNKNITKLKYCDAAKWFHRTNITELGGNIMVSSTSGLDSAFILSGVVLSKKIIKYPKTEREQSTHVEYINGSIRDF